MSEYPDGVCEFCGKTFPRPNKFRTENEAFHVYGCEVEMIKNIINNGELKELDESEVEEMIAALKRISKISSFGARKGNKYWLRMDECRETIKKINEVLNDKKTN